MFNNILCFLGFINHDTNFIAFFVVFLVGGSWIVDPVLERTVAPIHSIVRFVYNPVS